MTEIIERLQSNDGVDALPKTQYTHAPAGPLAGVRVLDLTRLLSGAQFGVVLADLGADVVKVERPGKGDELRAVTVGGGYDAAWRALSRNKRSITLNLKHKLGCALLFELAEKADILVENFSPGVLERLCGGPEALHERNPNLVIVRISGWGQTGPRAELPGFGTLAEAFSGFTFMNGSAGTPPLPPPFPLADTFAGTYGAAAALAALHHVRAGGSGQVVDVSLFEPLFSVMGADVSAYAATGFRRARGDGPKVSSVRGVFESCDGLWFAISALTEEIVERFFRGIGRLDLFDDPRFASSEARLSNSDALNEVLRGEFGSRTGTEIVALAEEYRVTIAPIYGLLDALRDEHYRARATIVEVEDGDERLVTHNVVPRLSATPGALRMPAPGLGEHSGAVFAELGIDEAELESLRAEGIV